MDDKIQPSGAPELNRPMTRGQSFDVIAPTNGEGANRNATSTPVSSDISVGENGEMVVDQSPAPTNEIAGSGFVAPAPIEVPVDDSQDPSVEQNNVAPTTSAEQVVPIAPTQPMKPKRHVSIIPIVVAVIIALALAGLTVFVYQKSNSKTEISSTSNSANVSAPAVTPATTKDVDAVTAAVDTALANNDATDTNDAELTDATLGL